MTDPNVPAQNSSEGTPEPADNRPDAPTEPIAPGPLSSGSTSSEGSGTAPVDDGPMPQTQAVADDGGSGKHVSVKRSWLFAGAGVGVLAVIGVAFGLGYLAGYDEGGDNCSHHERGDRMRGHYGEGGEFRPGMRWRMAPQDMQGRDGERPNRQNSTQSPSDSSTSVAPETVAPETTAPAQPG